MKPGVPVEKVSAGAGPSRTDHELGADSPTSPAVELGGAPTEAHRRRGLAHRLVAGADSADSGTGGGGPGIDNGYAGGLGGEDEGQRNRMAVAIDYKTHSKMPAAQPELSRRRHADRPPLPGPSANEAATSLGSAPPRIQDAADPEEALLLFFLEKMRHKHRLAQQDVVDKTEYMKYRPRQWETIEDRLKTLDIANEITIDDVSAANYRKDFVKQIQNHIKAIIETGKSVKISTRAAYLEREQKLLGKQANLGIKL